MKISLVSAFLLLLASSVTYAGSATWNLNATSGDWNTAANWTPATVPNGPTDIATFAVSNTLEVSLSASSTEVAAIVFNPGASSFNITADPGAVSSNIVLSISGAGITNNSGTTQSVIIAPSVSGHGGIIEFLNSASAGDNTAFTLSGSATSGAFNGGTIDFHNTSTAGTATIVAEGALAGNEAGGGEVNFDGHATAGNASVTINGALSKPLFAFGGQLHFLNFSSAGDAVFVINPGSGSNGGAGETMFMDHATAANGIFTLNGSAKKSSEGAQILFSSEATAANGFFTVNGGQQSGVDGGVISFLGSNSASAATFINNGGNGAGSLGGSTSFYDGSTASQSRLVANGGENGGGGGDIRFIYGSDGGEAQIEASGNGHLDVSIRDLPGVTVGSLAGDGLVYLASRNLTVGSNNLSTTFSGIIQETGGSGTGTGGSVTKIGTGTLTLSGANTYAGNTTISSGTLLVKNTTGSASGTGAVQVNGGTLGGKGIIAGAITVGTGSGTGSILQPGKGASTATTITLQNALTFKSDGTYSWKLNTKKAKADQVIANGLTIESGAQFDLTTVGNKKLTTGKVFTAISNTSATPISGTFANLADGSTVTVGVNKLQVSYSGGDGNDLTLTVVP